MCRTSGNRNTWCASRKSVRRSSVITLLCRLRPLILLRNRDGRSESSFKQTCMGQERRPWMSTPLPRPREARNAARGKTKRRQVKEVRRQLFLVWRVWSHDGRKCPKAKVAKARRERRTLTSGQTFRKLHRLMRATAEVAGFFVGAVSRHERYSQRDWQAWERIQKQARDQWKSYKSGTFVAMLSTLSWERELI